MSQQTLFSFFKKPTAPASGEKAASGPKGGDPAPRQRGTPAGGVPTPKGAKGSKGGGARGKVQPAARKAAPRAKPAKAAAPRGRKVVESDEEEEPAKESSKGRESKGAEGGGDEPPRKRPARATTAAPAAAARDESDEDEALMSSSDEESASEASVGESDDEFSAPSGDEGEEPVKITAAAVRKELAEEAAQAKRARARAAAEEAELSDGLAEADADDGTEQGTPDGGRKRSRAAVRTPQGPRASGAVRRAPGSSPSLGTVSTPARGHTVVQYTPETAKGVVLEAGQHEHNFLDWLANPRDAEGKRPDHPSYDPRTLRVPDSFLAKQTPAHRQWWIEKARRMDTVLFFKVGKFYEIFHMDADVAVKELGLLYMKGYKAHAGFPEIAYGKFSERLVGLGYKVSRVEQTETPEGLKKRNVERKRRGLRNDSVVARERCSVLSAGTRMHGAMDAVHAEAEERGSPAGASPGARGSPRTAGSADPANFLLAITEKEADRPAVASAMEEEEEKDEAEGESRPHGNTLDLATQRAAVVGVCLVDAATGVVRVGEFVDTPQRAHLRTLLTAWPVAEVVAPRGQLSDATLSALRSEAPTAVHSVLTPGDQFWSAARTVDEVMGRGVYYREADATGEGEGKRGKEEEDKPPVPPALEAMRRAYAGGADASGCARALSALGGAVSYLRDCLIDRDVLSVGVVSVALPNGAGAGQDAQTEALSEAKAAARRAMEEAQAAAESAGAAQSGTDADEREWAPPPVARMALDAPALGNLEVFHNSFNAGTEGTLVAFLDRTVTPGGRRTLREWIAAPLRDVDAVNGRLDAVDFLTAHPDRLDALRERLRPLPDLERMLLRIHTAGQRHRGVDGSHPDARAILYEADRYARRRIRDFVETLRAFEAVPQLVEEWEGAETQGSPLLRTLTSLRRKGGALPALRADLDYFAEAFDADEALRKGRIVPQPGVDEEVDGAQEEKRACEQALDEELASARAALGGGGRIKYYHAQRERFQIEVPEEVIKRQPGGEMPAGYTLSSSKKGVRRYVTDDTRALVARMERAEETRERALKDVMRRIFAQFDARRVKWASAARALAHLDVLCSLATVSAEGAARGPMCRPRVRARGEGEQPSFAATASRHPCVLRTFSGGDFIPNDIALGGAADGRCCLLLTGPNMGGKSTLLRQACLLVLMGQLGCHVPAESCEFTLVDRIFTRLGARDSIFTGHSTFFVELAETSDVLHQASADSMVILDELGRGTSTFDGTAIAHAVLQHLASRTRCLALFSTHYHSLVEAFEGHASVALGHMRCMVERKEAAAASDGDAAPESITFLYKLGHGACPKSYGMNVARLASLPECIVQTAHRESERFERALLAADARALAARTLAMAQEGNLEELRAAKARAAAVCAHRAGGTE